MTAVPNLDARAERNNPGLRGIEEIQWSPLSDAVEVGGNRDERAKSKQKHGCDRRGLNKVNMSM